MLILVLFFCHIQHAAAGPAGPRGRSQTALPGYREAQRREHHSEGGAAETQKGPSVICLWPVVFLNRSYCCTCSQISFFVSYSLVLYSFNQVLVFFSWINVEASSVIGLMQWIDIKLIDNAKMKHAFLTLECSFKVL